MRRKLLSARARKLLTLIFCIAFIGTFSIEAQTPKRARIWYFGDKAGLDFSYGHPVPITDGAMSAFEGCAVISDPTGQLLFYTNGGDLPYNGGVWNRNNQLMPNGDLSGAGGCSSSFQSSIILPHPKYENLYYLFTTDCIENNSVGGLRYSIIDMSLDGGLGDVAVKGNLLTTPVDESLAAVQHENGIDYWIVTHKIHTDSFYVYHLSAEGIVGVVKSKIGPTTPDYAGSIVVSTNGQKMVYSGLNFTALFDFDIETGEISNYLDLGIPSYSACFSPNCQFLYLADGVNKDLYQLEIYSDNIPSTAVLVGNTSSTGFGGMQMGPDKKIYVARFVTSDYLGMIRYPDVKGTNCDYIDNGIFLAGRYSKGGLPNFPNNMIGECQPYRGDDVPSYPNHPWVARVNPTDITSRGFNLTWQGQNQNSLSRESDNYRVLVRPVNKESWKVYYTNKNDFSIDDLAPGTSYEVKVLPAYENKDYQYLYDHFTDEVMNKNGNGSISDNKTIATTLGDFDFDLYPNPAKQSTTISIDVGKTASPVDIIVMQANGKIIDEYNHDGVIGLNKFTLQTNDLTNGIYNVAVETNASYRVKKLIVMK